MKSLEQCFGEELLRVGPLLLLYHRHRRLPPQNDRNGLLLRHFPVRLLPPLPRLPPLAALRRQLQPPPAAAELGLVSGAVSWCGRARGGGEGIGGQPVGGGGGGHGGGGGGELWPVGEEAMMIFWSCVRRLGLIEWA